MKLDLMYYYGNTAEQYSFYRIPKALFTDTHFQGVSMEAKLLYGLMLDRMGLSVRNGWLDSDGKVYIFFTLEDALAMLGYGKDKAVRLFKELDDIGLIERRKQGQGRPTRIYVKNFILPTDPGAGTPVPAAEEPLPQTSEKPKSALRDTPEVLTSEKQKSALRYIPEVLTSEIPKSGLLETRSLDFGKTDTNKTDKNKTEMSDTETPSTPLPPTPMRRCSGTNRRGEMEAYRAIIRENIDCDILLRDCGCDPNLLNGCVELMAEVCASTRETIRVNQEELPAELVRSRFLKLDMTHIAYALDVLTHAAAPVGNVRGYLLSVLYNAPTVMEQYYDAQVNHDMGPLRRTGGQGNPSPNRAR